MGGTILVQPDGRLALFSSIVDSLTVYDATDEELIDYLADRGRDDAEASARRAIERVRSGVVNPLAPTWEEAVADTLEHSSDEETRARFADGPNTPPPPTPPSPWLPPEATQARVQELLRQQFIAETLLGPRQPEPAGAPVDPDPAAVFTELRHAWDDHLAAAAVAIRAARNQGLTWEQVAYATGVDEQEARERWEVG
jgi:hypothetical protein